ncbi:MAG: discoidin domain-containing protein [Magnetococcales bacterium]|nr:discoidin domain-containing protein [Magnetococcales bacterium]
MGHRYWRVYITESTAGSNMLISLYEVEMRNANSNNMDLCNGGTASASHATNDAYKLFDNNTSSYWNNGSPGAPSWFCYDFGSGNPVVVEELWILPRYSSQSPQAFQCQWSDDGVTWNTQGSWTNQSWNTGYFTKYNLPAFTLPMVHAQRTLPYALALESRRLAGYDLGVFVHTTSNHLYAMALSRQQIHAYPLTLEQSHEQPCGFLLARANPQNYAIGLESGFVQAWQALLESRLSQPLYDTWTNTKTQSWSTRQIGTKDHVQPYLATSTLGPVVRTQPYDLLTCNLANAWQHHLWNHLPAATTRIETIPDVIWNGQAMELITLTLSWSAEQVSWVAHLTLAEERTFLEIHMDQPVTLEIQTIRFQMVVTGKELIRTASAAPQRLVTAMGRPIRHELPRALPFTRTWEQAVWARAAVEEALQETVIWELPNWRLPGQRLHVKEVAPLEVAKMMARAAGGVVRSRPDGQIVAAPLFPLPVPEWEKATCDHLLTDHADLIACRAELHPSTRINSVTVSEQTPELQPPELRLEIDPESHPGNQPHAPEQTIRLLAPLSPGVTLHSLAHSCGTWMPTEPVTRTHHELVRFTGSTRAVLSCPLTTIQEITWLGNDLGAVTLAADGRTLCAARPGVALAAVQGLTATHTLYPFKAPATVNGSDRFSALLVARADQTHGLGLSMTMQRHAEGEVRQKEILSPLLSDLRVVQSRAVAELDAGETLNTMHLTLVLKPEIQPGSMVEVQDGWYGTGYRGVVIAVSHEITRNQANTRLQVVTKGG